MMPIEKLLIENDADVFGCFLAAYLFGSVLAMRSPTDVDLVLVYSSGRNLDSVSSQVRKTRDTLSRMLEGLIIDLTVLSQTEFEHANFLDRLPAWVQVK